MKKLIILSCLLSIFAIDAKAALTQEEKKERLEKRFNKMDANNNGKVSYKEFTAKMKKKFQKFDQDSNGILSHDEFVNAWKHKGKKAFKKLDTDNSGSITASEFNAKKEKRFKKMDKNEDGVLSSEESLKWRTKYKKDFFSRLSNVFEGGDMTLEDFTADHNKKFAMIDEDQDGKITLEEFSKYRLEKHRKH